MALQIDTVAHACKIITRQVRDHCKNLTMHYIVHHDGQLKEALGLTTQEIISHPAAETAIHLLQQHRNSEESALLGTAVARQNLFFGLATRDSLLALCTMNIDQFDSLKEARRHAYHLVWHALDAHEYHNNPANRSGNATEIIIRKRNALEIANANLQADVFSGVVSAMQRDRDAIRRIALSRAQQALETNSMHSPEFYPFPIAMEATESAVENLVKKQPSKKRLLQLARKIAGEVGKTFDEETLHHWLSFTEPAQDMAWRGSAPEEILSAAINTSKDTYVRATGYLVSEITEIDPISILDISESYSPFADEKFNEQLHERAIEEIFEDVIAQGLKQNSGIPFIKLANQQNISLMEGRVVGWCASALQAAGAAYETAVRDGHEPDKAAREEFEVEKKRTSWDGLMELGKKIIKQQRHGHNVTMSELDELCKEIEDMRAVRQSLEKTQNDASYKQKMEAAQDLAPDLPKAAPTPNAPSVAPRAPTAANLPGMAGMGGMGRGMGSGLPAGAVQQQKQKDAKDKSGKDGKGEQTK